MIKLGKIKISNSSAVVHSRKRIFHAVKSLRFSLISATRISSAVSEVCRNYYKDGELTVELCIGKSRRVSSLYIRISGMQNHKMATQVEKLFSTFNYVEASKSMEATCQLPHPDIVSDQSLIDNIIKKLNIPSNSELLTEVETQNRILKTQSDELNIAIKEAKQSAEAKSQFLANVSHEIRTPMNAIIGLNHLLEQTQLNSSQKDYAKKIGDSAKSLLRIINDILDFSKIEAGKVEIEEVEFNLEETVTNISNMLAISAFEKCLEFIVDIDPKVPKTLMGDPLRLTQVILNLTSNAIKFTSKGEVVIQVKIKGDNQLTFIVKDTGIGMSKAQSAKIFSPFSQADLSTTRKYGGTGLGLVISQNLVEMMGGEIKLETEPHRGSQFMFTLPMKPCSQGVPQKFNSDNKKVIVVDSNEASSQTLEKYLKQLDLEPCSFKSLKEALKETENNPQMVFIAHNLTTDTKSFTKLSEKIKNIIIMSEVQKLANSNDAIRKYPTILKPITPSVLHNTLVDLTDSNHHLSTQSSNCPPNADKLEGARILLVEDNEINQQVASEILRNRGIYVHIANNGAEAVTVMESAGVNDFDLILMDIQMPVMDGREATKKIRALESHISQIPIIAMTAHAFSEEKQKNLQVGMNEQINKPIDLQEIFSTIANFIKIKPSTPNQVEDSVTVIETESVALKISVDGLNTEEALERLANNIKLYDDLLISFERKFKNAFEELKTLLSDKNFKESMILAHTIKGTGGNLGAKNLYLLASQLEQLYKKETENDKLLTTFKTELDFVCNGINKYIGNKTITHNKKKMKIKDNKAIFKEKLLQLSSQLDDFDSEALTTISELEEFDIPQKSLFAEISDLINGLEFDEAAGKLSNFTSLHNINL